MSATTAPALDPVIHPLLRFRFCAALAGTGVGGTVEFVVLRDALDVSDSQLSKIAAVLKEAGYVTVSKQAADGRRRTWLSLTGAGRRAYGGHVAALREIAATTGA
ncbi:transcriptional regulator [Motilibacter aurantiacus]|uniref:transcriptional regulator n=1 Tax=Motilibacter aurantiacus TaxID=2714955 RepID=UPI001407360C|nr:transcriptional regulator [Motilibacter aurantiacus]NHC46599.1 winged helix DNA-binding protein [Motilibacter aurantiacus]